jgi:hypothetical protein
VQGEVRTSKLTDDGDDHRFTHGLGTLGRVQIAEGDVVLGESELFCIMRRERREEKGKGVEACWESG